MASRTRGLRARRLRAGWARSEGPPSQGITGRLLIRALTPVAVVLVTSPGLALAQGAGQGRSVQPPAFSEPDPTPPKFPGHPLAEPPPPEQRPPVPDPAPPKFPGHPLAESPPPEQRPPVPDPTPPKWPGAPYPPDASQVPYA